MYIALNIVLLVCGFLFTKFYTQNETEAKSIAIFILIDGILGFIVMAVRSNLDFSVYDIIYGAIVGVLSCFNLVVQLKAYKYGDLSVYTLFLMLGGMILPVFYGKIFLAESFSIVYYFTIPIIVACMFLSISPHKFKKGKTYYILCVLVFASNGILSVLSKKYSVNYHNNYAMLCWKYIFEVLFASIYIFILRKSFVLQKDSKTLTAENLADDEISRKSEFSEKTTAKTNKLTILNKKSSLIYAVAAFAFSGLAYFIQLSVLKNTDAVLFFPIQTCGTILLSFIAGKAIFKEEKENRELVFSTGILLSFILTIICI